MRLLVVGGWEPRRLAGVGVDLRVVDALGVPASAALTSVTAQGARTRIEPTPLDVFGAQLEPCDVVKIGLVSTAAHAEAIARWLEGRRCRVVLDPVIRSSTGAALWRGVPTLDALVRRADLVTPNLDEGEALTGARDAETIADRLRARGASAVLVKGGHRQGPVVRDLFVGDERLWLEGDRRADGRGTGCTLATATACGLARGETLIDAIVFGSAYVRRGLRGVRDGALAHGAWPVDPGDLPAIVATPADAIPAFAAADEIGFYPLVARACDVAAVAALGVTMAQLRCKDLDGAALVREVRAAVIATRGTRCRLVVNDRVDLALEHGAWGAHLGQEDLAATPRELLRAAQRRGLGLGVSTHGYAELARALAVKPSYVALGPIWPTKLKAMRQAPQGPARVAEWKALAGVPVVAIGGVTPERVHELRAADGVCVLSDLQPDVATRARAYLT